jgi:hypothetical protein
MDGGCSGGLKGYSDQPLRAKINRITLPVVASPEASGRVTYTADFPQLKTALSATF